MSDTEEGTQAPVLDKPLFFIGPSHREVRALPVEVKRVLGFALRQAQRGRKHRDAKPLKGFGGAGVLEVVVDHATNTYRGIYTVRFSRAVYVLHAFQKKSTTGKKTATHVIALINQRLNAAEEHYESWLATQNDTTDTGGGK